jgi:transposase-like protein
MPMPTRYRGYRFSGTIIGHCVWLYFRFNLSLRDVQEIMAKDGVTVSHETIRRWCRKFGLRFTQALRRRWWHLLSAGQYRILMNERFHVGHEATATAAP